MRASAAGVRVVRLDVGKGFLRVAGRSGADEIVATGVAHTTSARSLDSVRIASSRAGDTLVVEFLAQPTVDSTRGDMSIDVELHIPSTVGLDVVDSAGESVFRNVGPIRIVHGEGGLNVDSVAGNVDVTDGGGDMIVSHVSGDVRVVDLDGGIYVAHVSGSVNIPRAGSGEIQADAISGDVIVGSKRSGEVAAREIGGQLSVRAMGSGSIEYRDVRGRVSVATAEHH
jgi:hypothetical protein